MPKTRVRLGWGYCTRVRYGTANAFVLSGALLVVMAIQKERIDERMIESDEAQRKSNQT